MDGGWVWGYSSPVPECEGPGAPTVLVFGEEGGIGSTNRRKQQPM
jgi:hypothetical protein